METTPGIDADREDPAMPGVWPVTRPPHRSRVVIPKDQAEADSEAIRFAMADLRLAAWFLWMTPLLTALSS
jgi:hypothetical protein